MQDITLSKWFWFKHMLNRGMNALGDYLFIGGIVLLGIFLTPLQPLILWERKRRKQK